MTASEMLFADNDDYRRLDNGRYRFLANLTRQSPDQETVEGYNTVYFGFAFGGRKFND